MTQLLNAYKDFLEVDLIAKRDNSLGLPAGMRSMRFQKYVIFYRTRGDTTKVIRVLRATRDRSGPANLNSAISGNSGHRAGAGVPAGS